MSNFKLSQEFVRSATDPSSDAGPDVIGPNDAPTPTEALRIERWKQAYVARFVEVGFDVEHGIADYEGALGEHDYSQDPVEAADESLSYYEDDGDLA